MRKKVIIGNWKMNKNVPESILFIEELEKFSKKINKEKVTIGIAAPYLCLPSIAEYSGNLIIAAENCMAEDNGAFTGEISASMLNNIGIKSCIVGHSERRKYFNETNQKCMEKIHKLLNLNMDVIYCVGETLEEYEQGISKEVVKKQLIEGLKNVNENDMNNVIIAYEPVWSIGTGKSASKEIAEDMCKFIRDIISKFISNNASKNAIIQYGGSVKPSNSFEYLSCPNIDGVLVGGASLSIDSFTELIMKGIDNHGI